jgi:hypothetical protein
MGTEKSIETKELTIKGNIMYWAGTMVQLSNVSCISMSNLMLMPFPKVALVLVLAGCIGFKVNPTVGAALFLVGIGWILYWYSVNESRKKVKNLNLMLNSGINLNIQINNDAFLAEVLEVLQNILIHGGIGKNNNISINIQDNKFEGSSQVLNNLGIFE